MNLAERIYQQRLEEALSLFQRLKQDETLVKTLSLAIGLTADTLRSGGKIITCGNGGSMAQAIHLAEELSGRYKTDRPPLAAIAISDPGHISCVANDYGYEKVFSRFIEAMGKAGDILILFTTSGASRNLIEAAQSARSRKIKTIIFCGSSPNPLSSLADVVISAPGEFSSAGIQEWHAVGTHIFVEALENMLFPEFP
jgi:D-sedoheptulose 7-phosphate isomerase